MKLPPCGEFQSRMNLVIRGGKSSCSLWSELQVIESKSSVVIDCLRRENVSKLA